MQMPCRDLDVDEYLISYVNELPVTSRDITLHGWPSVVADPVLEPYCSRKQEPSVDQGCVLWGLRVDIPKVLRVRLLDDVPQEHHGICRSLWSLWQGLIFGGRDKIRRWISLPLGHLYSRESGLSDGGSAHTSTFLRRTS